MKTKLLAIIALLLFLPVQVEAEVTYSVVSFSSNGFVGQNQSTSSAEMSNSGHAWSTEGGYTPTSLGTVSYVHTGNFGNNINNVCRIAIFDSTRTLLVQSVKFTANNNDNPSNYHVALESPLVLTNQTYYIALTANDSGYIMGTFANAALSIKEDNRIVITDYDVGWIYTTLQNWNTQNAGHEIVLWATNTADGS